MGKTRFDVPLRKQAALERLFADSSHNRAREDCFDGFGNYRYPTDMIIDTPNIALGSAEGLAYQTTQMLSSKPSARMSGLLP